MDNINQMSEYYHMVKNTKMPKSRVLPYQKHREDVKDYHHMVNINKMYSVLHREKHNCSHDLVTGNNGSASLI